MGFAILLLTLLQALHGAAAKVAPVSSSQDMNLDGLVLNQRGPIATAVGAVAAVGKGNGAAGSGVGLVSAMAMHQEVSAVDAAGAKEEATVGAAGAVANEAGAAMVAAATATPDAGGDAATATATATATAATADMHASAAAATPPPSGAAAAAVKPAQTRAAAMAAANAAAAEATAKARAAAKLAATAVAKAKAVAKAATTSASMAALQQEPPAAPLGVRCTAGERMVTLAWSHPADPPSGSGAPVLSYRVSDLLEQRVMGVVGHKGPPANSAVVTGLVNGHTYAFYVQAENQWGRGPRSLPTSCTPFHSADECAAVSCSGHGACFPNYNIGRGVCVCQLGYGSALDCSTRQGGASAGQFGWHVGGWGQCSDTCGGEGLKRREVACAEFEPVTLSLLRTLPVEQQAVCRNVAAEPAAISRCNPLTCGETKAVAHMVLEMRYADVSFSSVAAASFEAGVLYELARALRQPRGRFLVAGHEREGGHTALNVEILPTDVDADPAADQPSYAAAVATTHNASRSSNGVGAHSALPLHPVERVLADLERQVSEPRSFLRTHGTLMRRAIRIKGSLQHSSTDLCERVDCSGHGMCAPVYSEAQERPPQAPSGKHGGASAERGGRTGARRGAAEQGALRGGAKLGRGAGSGLVPAVGARRLAEGAGAERAGDLSSRLVAAAHSALKKAAASAGVDVEALLGVVRRGRNRQGSSTSTERLSAFVPQSLRAGFRQAEETHSGDAAGAMHGRGVCVCAPGYDSAAKCAQPVAGAEGGARAQVVGWFAGPWSVCSRGCGGGTRTRSVTCAVFERGRRVRTVRPSHVHGGKRMAARRLRLNDGGGADAGLRGTMRQRDDALFAQCAVTLAPSDSQKCNTFRCGEKYATAILALHADLKLLPVSRAAKKAFIVSFLQELAAALDTDAHRFKVVSVGQHPSTSANRGTEVTVDILPPPRSRGRGRGGARRLQTAEELLARLQRDVNNATSALRRVGTWGRLINDDRSKGFLSIGSNVVLPFNVHRRGKMSGGLLMMTLVVLGGAIFMVVRLIGKIRKRMMKVGQSSVGDKTMKPMHVGTAKANKD